MKRLILTAILVIGMAATAFAQPKAIGGRLGWGIEASYQHNMGAGANFLEADLGLFAFTGLNVSGIYNFMIAQPEWTTKGTWGFYAGPGVGAGISFLGPVQVSVMGQVGLEYNFEKPVQISLDIRPQFGVQFYGGSAYFYAGGLLGFVPCLAVRYRF